MKINPNKVIEDRLAASFGLEQYGYIISHWKTVDVSADEDFQTKFNGYYRVRRNAEWMNRRAEVFMYLGSTVHFLRLCIAINAVCGPAAVSPLPPFFIFPFF